MKIKFYPIALLLLVISANLTAQVMAPATNKQPLPASASDDWYANATSRLAASGYKYQSTPGNEVFSFANNDNGLTFDVSANGYTVKGQRSSREKAWFAQFTLLGFPAEAAVASCADNKIVYRYGNVDVEYINDKNGMRQNFIVQQKPSGGLRVQMKIESPLRVMQKKNHIEFIVPGQKEARLAYDDLKVWDARKKIVPASMQLDPSTNIVSLVVDDAEAVYPVTIDPLNHSTEWQSSANGLIPALLGNLSLQVQSLYGFTVTGLGDVNGDSYDDVAVSAPGLADVISGSGSLASVGAVFVYFGSDTGLADTPDRVLQPNTLVAGSLFGYSVAAGDVTGDGINDIIVGAPLDGVTVNFGAGQILNGQVGKVYVFTGGTLTGSNPTPLVSVSLSTPLLNTSTISVHALFGFSVAVADDLNSDGKGEIVVGSPTYAQINGATSIKAGGAFVLLSNASNTFSTVRSLEPPTGSLLGLYSTVQNLVEALPLGSVLWAVAGPLLSNLLNGQIEGMLFGFSVDGVGDYNNDGRKDVVVGAPAGVNLGSLASGISLASAVSNLLSGQILGGSAYVFSGTGVPATGINTTAAARLQAQSTGLLSNAANLFGYQVKGSRYANGARSGNIMIGAPMGSVLANLAQLKVNAGQLNIFQRKTAAFTNPVVADQTLSSPRSTSIVSILTGQTLNLSLLYGSSFDVVSDANCDGIADLVVGEPLSTPVGLVSADLVGGAAYVYYGNANGTYATTPAWSLFPEVSADLGVNATAMIGKSVAGTGRIMGPTKPSRALIGGASNSLDFGAGLLNLGNTVGTLNSFAFENNGVGKAYTFVASNCNITLPASLLSFTGEIKNKAVELKWVSEYEQNLSGYELERSTDATNFSPVALVFARGEQRNSYTYPDKHPVMGTNYYRLKIKDVDGKVTYSDIVIVRFNEKLPGDIVIAPNPVTTGVIKMRLTGMDKGTYIVRMHNSIGQAVYTSQLTVTQHDQLEEINRTASIPAGVYYLNIYDKTNKLFKTVRVLVSNE